MTDTLEVAGTFDGLVSGYVVFEDLPYVLTVSESYLTDGWPEWSYRYAHPEDPRFDQSLGDMRGGSANIYNGNPVAFQVPAGKFDLGYQGSIVLATDYLGVFDDFAVFPAAGQDPTLSGWVHPNSPDLVDAPVGDITTAWAQASVLAFPPTNARYVVPVVNAQNIPANSSVYLDAFDMRVTPYNADPTVKPTYASPRSLVVKVKPTRLNLATGSTHVTSLTAGQTYIASADVNGTRESFTFVPTTSTYDLTFSGTPTKILVEEGSILRDYFDGDSGGADYLWEQGGTPGSTRSYYYQDREARNYILIRLLQENVPLGMTVGQPEYATYSAP